MKKSSFSTVNKHLETLLKKGREEGVFEGAAAGVFKYNKKEERKLIVCHGKTRKDDEATSVNEDTFFDLASLTKPLCTVLTTLHLVEKNKISFDTEAEKALFETKTHQNLKKIKIRHLLSHSSGFKAYNAFYKFFQPLQEKENKKRLIHSILKESLEYPVGEKSVYSDLGYILLGEIVEHVSGKRLDKLFTSTIAKPLELEKKLIFRPVDKCITSDKSEIAATQFCPWRQRMLQGEVDDEHCWLMNGVAGHAGLFGTIQGVLDLCAHILNQWKGREEHPSYSNTLLNKVLTKQYTDRSWCMGFDTPTQPGSSAGNYISSKSVGHLGFTGTSFWIDPEKDMVIVLLTNRIHPTRNNEKIKKFRPLFHDTVYKMFSKE